MAAQPRGGEPFRCCAAFLVAYVEWPNFTPGALFCAERQARSRRIISGPRGFPAMSGKMQEANQGPEKTHPIGAINRRRPVPCASWSWRKPLSAMIFRAFAANNRWFSGKWRAKSARTSLFPIMGRYSNPRTARPFFSAGVFHCANQNGECVGACADYRTKLVLALSGIDYFGAVRIRKFAARRAI